MSTNFEDTKTENPIPAVRPKLLCESVDIEGDDNFVQGCQFSPDGSCILTSTARDGMIRLYNAYNNNNNNDNDNNHKLSWRSALSVKGGECVRCYDWYPFMNSQDPSTCAFLVASRGRPVHLVDAYTGHLRASYRPYNALDEMESPNVVTFSPNGAHILCGGFPSDRILHLFDTSQPGRTPTCIYRLGKTRHSKDGQKGLVSALAYTNNTTTHNNVFAVGTYSPGSIYLYDQRISPSPTITLHDGISLVSHGKRQKQSRKRTRFTSIDDNNNNQDQDDWLANAKQEWYQRRTVHQSGITQLTFQQDDTFLYAACRKSHSILLWDMRKMSSAITTYPQYNPTNQRLQFHLHNHHLYVTNANRTITIYRTNTNNNNHHHHNQQKPIHTMDGFMDTVNGVSYHSSMLAVGVGARRFHTHNHYDDDDDDDSDKEEQEDDTRPPGSLQLYSLQTLQNKSIHDAIL